MAVDVVPGLNYPKPPNPNLCANMARVLVYSVPPNQGVRLVPKERRQCPLDLHRGCLPWHKVSRDVPVMLRPVLLQDGAHLGRGWKMRVKMGVKIRADNQLGLKARLKKGLTNQVGFKMGGETKMMLWVTM